MLLKVVRMLWELVKSLLLISRRQNTHLTGFYKELHSSLTLTIDQLFIKFHYALCIEKIKLFRNHHFSQERAVSLWSIDLLIVGKFTVFPFLLVLNRSWNSWFRSLEAWRLYELRSINSFSLPLSSSSCCETLSVSSNMLLFYHILMAFRSSFFSVLYRDIDYLI